MERLIMIGAGGHSKSVADSLQKDKYELCGFLDENKAGNHMGYPILGNRIENIENYREYVYFISIGDVNYRKIWYEKVKELNLRIINIIDETAIISKNSKIGEGNFIGKYAILNAGSMIGNNNVINTKALIEHECQVGNHTHLSTNSTINGNVVVHDSVFFGSTAVCNGQLEIGEHAIIGSGSVVINNVEKYTTVVGVPAHVVKRRTPDE